MAKTNRPSTLVFIRHAESVRNVVRRGGVYFPDEESRQGVAGIPDHLTPITERGEEQARQTGIALRKRFGVPHYLYHSGYLRTERTAELILDAYTDRQRARINVRQNLFIRERDPGHAFDMTEEEVARHFPWLKGHWDSFGGFFAKPPGGESLAQVTERAYAFLNMLFRDRAGQKVFVVTHGGTLRCFRYLLERWTYRRAIRWAPDPHPANCCVTCYEYDADERRLVLRDYNTVYWTETATAP